MDAKLDALARAELSLASERQRYAKLEAELRETRQKLYALEAKVIVDPKLRQDLLSQINGLKRENNVLKSKLGNYEKVPEGQFPVPENAPFKPAAVPRPRPARKGEDSIMAKLRETYPECWSKG